MTLPAAQRGSVMFVYDEQSNQLCSLTEFYKITRLCCFIENNSRTYVFDKNNICCSVNDI